MSDEKVPQHHSKGEAVTACSPTLRGKDRRYLRGLGHHLKPVVLVGDKGLHEGVIAQIEQALEDHELIKVKLRGADAAERREAAVKIFTATGGNVVQILGRTLLVYRRRDDDPKITLPKA